MIDASTFTFRLLSPPPAFRRVNFGPRFSGDRLGSTSTTQGYFDGLWIVIAVWEDLQPDSLLIGKGHRNDRHGVAGRGLGASGKTPAGSTEEKAEPVAISVVELAPTYPFDTTAWYCSLGQNKRGPCSAPK